MATAKKTTAKKAPAAKKAPVKKKTVAKKTSAKKVSAKKAPPMRSFRVAPEATSFTTFKITRQTIYWVIIVAFLIFMQLWILKLQIEVIGYLDAEAASLEADM